MASVANIDIQESAWSSEGLFWAQSPLSFTSGYKYRITTHEHSRGTANYPITDWVSMAVTLGIPRGTQYIPKPSVLQLTFEVPGLVIVIGTKTSDVNRMSVFGYASVAKSTQAAHSRLFRQASAEWLRTAFHDAITHDKSTGTGGVDASLRYELDRPENAGTIALNSTFSFFSGFQSVRSSMADLVALGVYTAVRECGGPVVKFRAGRVDAKGPGEAGVACGHTIGGVHGNDFPEITGNNSEESFPKFDSTNARFDSQVVTEYLAGNTTNVLVVGPDATNSDRRIFASDNNATMNTLADSGTFRATCADILQRMVDTVPSSVTLTDPIEPIDVKPANLKFYMTSEGNLRFEGQIRIRWTNRSGDPPPVVQIRYEGGIIEAAKATFQGGIGLGFDDWFQFYEFQHSLQPNTSLTSFTVEFNDEVHTNGGGGFPIHNELLVQHLESCLAQTGAPLSNLTIVAAVQQDRVHLPTYFEVAIKKTQMGIVGAVDIERQRVDMRSTGRRVGGYEILSGFVGLPTQTAFTTYDVVNGDVRVEFQKTASVSSSCTGP
uniref:Peroxidase n=1 Tax=Moniliophthora roreri TaxID=221103 RepID=A0A0W0G977_MONRR